ncbi:MAG: hypothetical protein OHK006_13580 [Thermodesulfovibrionales bacterium]
MKRAVFLYSFMIIVALLCAAGIVLAETATPVQPTMKKIQPKPAAPAVPAAPAAPAAQEMRAPTGSIVLKAPDLVAELAYSKTIAGGKGIVTLNGRICNRGTANYQSPPMGPAHATLAGYDPSRPLTADNYRIIAGQDITSLAIGACAAVNGTYEIPLIIQWEHRTAVSGECAIAREFSVSVGRNVPDDPNFRRSEDLNPLNNIVKKQVKAMVQCPW